MPILQISPDLEMNYLVDNFTEPWTDPETVLLLHGASESGAVWYGWVPHLARHYRVVRPDMRGFGKSTPMPSEYPWTLDRIIDDYLVLMDALHIKCCHLVGAKLGGTVARRFAACHPERIRSLVVVGSPPAQRSSESVAALANVTKQDGANNWAGQTMSSRLGQGFPEAGTKWWAELMRQTPESTLVGFRSTISGSDVSADLPRIKCPTLVITSEGSAHGSVESTRAWQQMIPQSKLCVLPGDSYHIAASDPDRCARETFDFISRVGAT